MKFFKKSIAFLLVIVVFCTPLQVYASEMNTGVVSYLTPTSAETTALRWSLKMGTSYKNAPSTQIVVDDTLVFMSGKMLYKVDIENGEIIRSAEMVDYPSFSYTAPTYADGVVYCPLENGTVQAFNYRTLSSMWIYKDQLSGQALTEIVYSDGYIYTGFWNNEDAYANYVCIDVRDEDVFSKTEEKSAEWTYKSLGGFYWAKAVIYGDSIIFGCDDGTNYDNKPSKLVSLNKYNGSLIDTYAIQGDQRSGVTICESYLYAATKAGYLYRVKLNSDGTFSDGDSKKLSLGGASTSAPVIYKNRLYLGVQGESFGKGYMKVIDAKNLKVIYSAQTKGYPQNSVLVSNAYEDKVYIYTTYNAGPGGISVFTDKPGQTSAVSSDLFLPEGDMRGYCISSIAVSEDGTLFYKNDSGYIFALENTENQPEEENWFIKFINSIIDFFKNLFGIG